ncbi:DUF2115 domain-containing protein [Methanobacterium alcaliphilum]|uniref:DUF2115 domain-containing protein n=1 Tax=Methanobacterium alcaliphilum TaxID=392018 RepID=UPI00200AE6F7|nr:DUF2115 domain-containing protein [Methanobacterium alcaliphilum]MCK9150871.1 DUF2115 domain-containing protein [Methanobacterium alcaliphilum]
MISYLDKIDFSHEISKNNLLKILKKEASNIHIKEIMDASIYLKEDAKFMPSKERDEFIERFTRAFFIRIKDLKEDKETYHGQVNLVKLKEFFKILDKQRKNSKCHEELCFQKIAKIVATYTAFVKKESIHPVGTKFPGGFILRYENGVYYCPVKEKQLNTPGALCRFCVSVQDEMI